MSYEKSSGGEPPAVQARRLRRLKLLLLVPYSAFFLVIVLIFDHAGWFASKSVQIVFSAVIMLSILSLGAWKSNVPCPRCGWNIYFRKTKFRLLATYVPSSCPNCGLDLEKPYVGKRAAE
jgi:predicted RNA-binding Zn-ribbon protein involved in translation (DUF1610 family)